MKKLDTKYILPVLILLYSMNFMDRSVLGIVGDALKADLGLSDGQLGLLHSILLIALIGLMIPCAALNDLLGRRRFISFAAAAWTAAMALTGTAASFVHLVCARALGSINEATMGAGGSAWLASNFPVEKRGKVMGLYQVSAPLGMALGMLLGGMILALTGSWRATFFLFILPGIFCVIAIPMLPDNQPKAQKGYFKSLPKLLKNRTILICAVGAGFYCITKFSYQAWLPVLLLRSYEGLAPWMAGAMVAAFLLIGVAGPILGGTFSDILNRRFSAGRVYAVVACMALVAVSKFVLYYVIGIWSLPWVFAYGLFDGLVTMMPLPIYFTMIQDIVPNHLRSGAVGIFGMLTFLLGAAWGPLLVGFFSDFFGGGGAGLRLAQLTLVIFLVLSAIAFACTVKTYVRDKESVNS